MNEKSVTDQGIILEACRICEKITASLNQVIIGQEKLTLPVLAGILSRGHILLEGVPGLGKTVLVKTLSTVMNLQFSRVQFTPDLMPGDILGSHILQETSQGKRELLFRKGPVFTNILLADEINRASPKTQSALLEAMQEKSVSLMGNTEKLPDPFFVLATQNPIEQEGTYPLPEAQMDRFLFRLRVKMIGAQVMEQIIESRRREELPHTGLKLEYKELMLLFEAMNSILLPKQVANYIARLAAATHPGNPESTDFVKKYVSYGVSPRAAIASAESARAMALISGRPAAGFSDASSVIPHVFNHRIILNYKARIDGIDQEAVCSELLKTVPEVQTALPDGVSIR